MKKYLKLINYPKLGYSTLMLKFFIFIDPTEIIKQSKIYIAVPIQIWYNITSQSVGARHCRAPTGVPY